MRKIYLQYQERNLMRSKSKEEWGSGSQSCMMANSPADCSCVSVCPCWSQWSCTGRIRAGGSECSFRGPQALRCEPRKNAPMGSTGNCKIDSSRTAAGNHHVLEVSWRANEKHAIPGLWEAHQGACKNSRWRYGNPDNLDVRNGAERSANRWIADNHCAWDQRQYQVLLVQQRVLVEG